MSRIDDIKQRYDEGRPIRKTDVKFLLNVIEKSYSQIEELNESKRREKAAISDMKDMAQTMRESEELQENCCFACKFAPENNDSMEPWHECPGYEKDDCFEWRGSQEEIVND